MIHLTCWLLFFVGFCIIFYFELPVFLFFGVCAGFLLAYGFHTWELTIFLTIAIICSIPLIRREVFTKWILMIIVKKKLLPTISETEQIAIDAGDTWVEAELFSGKPNFVKIKNEMYKNSLNAEEKDFMENQVNSVCEMADDWQIFQDKDMPKEVWDYLKREKFFGMLIPKQYGGLEFSAYAQSCVVAKLATRSQVLAITAMVPNSLGPAELLLKYGTESQKNYYLPRLADGRDIPCFALTEPNAGSDAASIRSNGVVFKDSDDGKLKVRLNFEKRYITLGGIATVIGLAFDLKDPEGLLPKSDKIKTGISCALLPSDIVGLTRGKRHYPMGVPFINSPLWGKDVVISVEEHIIGGAQGCGNGWKMLMECLGVGRGISLPAVSIGGSKLATQVAFFHANVRRQFGLPLAKFEGIEEQLAKMIVETYTTDALRTFVASGVCLGHRPSVANAIAKYHATESFRRTMNIGMDILGGQGICLGRNNLLAHGYMGVPVAITVEGANILTRTLLQFGQGLIRCHPYIYKEMVAISKNDLKEFDKNLFAHIKHFISNRVRMLVLGISSGKMYKPFGQNFVTHYEGKIAWASASFAWASDIAMLIYGGNLKRKEAISGRFGDIVSAMFIATCVLRRFVAEGSKKEYEPIVEASIEGLLKQIDDAFNSIYSNLSGSKAASFFGKIFGFAARHNNLSSGVKDSTNHAILKAISEKQSMFSNILSDVFVSNDHSDHLARLELAYTSSEHAMQIYKKIKEFKLDLVDAYKTGVISKMEYDLVLGWEELAKSVIQVDFFDLETNNAIG